MAKALDTLALLAELRGNSDEVLELNAAAREADRLTPGELRALLRDADRTSPGLTRGALAHLRALASDGVGTHVQNQHARLPRDLAAVLRQRSLEEMIALHRESPIVTVADLRARCDAARRKPDRLPRICHGLDAIVTVARTSQPRLMLGRAVAVLEPLLERVGAVNATLVPVGGVRRVEPTVGDILILGAAEQPADAVARIAAQCDPGDIRHRSTHALSLVVEREEVNLRFVAPDRFGTALMHYTGSFAHLQQLRERAAQRHLRLTAHGLFDAGRHALPSATETDVYGALGLPVVPPELRHGLDEITLAEQGRLGELLTLEQIRGDLHCHTLWSDGRDTTEGIVWAARALGYDYVAITDHSPTAAASRVLSIDRLRQQATEIATLRLRHPEITILHGIEVDILGDGTLDFPDAILEGLDIVLASLHEAHGHDGTRLLSRYTRAMEHPLVNVITHPANRTPGRSEGYELDWDAFFSVASRTGTAVEVDGAPGHLDLDGRLARRAADAGVTLTVDSDGHFAERLGRQMRMGVGTARRGAVPARSVLNARPLADVRAFVAAKRQR